MYTKNDKIEYEACEPGVKRKVMGYNEEMMMVEVSFEKGAEGYVHSHPHLQMAYVIKGSFEFTIEGKTELVKAGDTILIPREASHGAKALEESMLLDVFTPMRQDFIK